MDVRVRHRQHKGSEAFARLHPFLCDHLFDERGTDNGMTPVELIPSALRWRALRDAARFLRVTNSGLDNIHPQVLAESSGQALPPVAVGSEVTVPVNSARARIGLIKAIKVCPRTLTARPKLKLNLAALATEKSPATKPSIPGS